MQHDYELSKRLSSAPFYALLMAAMRVADTDNLAKLRAAWPDVWKEIDERSAAPGGKLPTDSDTPGYTDFIFIEHN